jgi:deoxycytidylate deaminase
MLKINGIEVQMEGPFSDLIKEVARLAHAISKTASEKFQEDTNGEVSYDHVVEMILEELAKLKRFDVEDIDLPKEIKEDFNSLLQKEFQDNEDQPSFINYDTSRPDKNLGTTLIQGVIKGVYQDNENLDTVKKKKKKKRKE